MLPKERRLSKLPNVAVSKLKGWGICEANILGPGKNCEGERRRSETITLKRVVTDLRHSVAHILFKTYGNGTDINEIEFKTDRSKFKAKVTVDEFTTFVKKLAKVVTVRSTGA